MLHRNFCEGVRQYSNCLMNRRKPLWKCRAQTGTPTCQPRPLQYCVLSSQIFRRSAVNKVLRATKEELRRLRRSKSFSRNRQRCLLSYDGKRWWGSELTSEFARYSQNFWHIQVPGRWIVVIQLAKTKSITKRGRIRVGNCSYLISSRFWV